MIGDAPAAEDSPSIFHRRGVQIAVFVLLALAIPIARAGGSFPTAGFFHSDIAFLPALFEDLTHGGSLADWGLPEAPYFIPDWPLYFVAWLLAPSYQWALTIFAFLQISLLLGVWHSIVRQVSRSAFLSTVIGAGVLILVALFDFVPIDYISVSFAHFGTVILALGAVSLYLRLGDAGVSIPRWVLPTLGALTLASSASDRIYVVWAVAPLVALELLPPLHGLVPPLRRLGLVAHERVRPQVLGVLTASATVGVILGRLAVRSSGNYKANLINSTSFMERLNIAEFIFRHEDLSFRFSAVTVLLILVWFGSVVLDRGNRLNTVLFSWFFLAVSAAVIVQFLVADFAWRYHQFLYQIPLLAVGLWLPRLSRAVMRSNLPTIALAGLLVVAAVGKGTINSIGATETYSLAEVECLDSILKVSGSREGVGNLAAARLAVVMSDLELEVGARNSFLSAEEDVHSRAWARNEADFAIVYPTIFGVMPEASLLALGQPLAIEQCGRWRILDFGPGGLDLDRLTKVGGTAVVLGCWIPAENGVAGEGCTLAVDSMAEDPDALPVTLKAYFPAEPGLYNIRIEVPENSPSVEGVMEIGEFDQYTGAYVAFETLPLDLLGGVYEVQPGERDRSLAVKVLNTSSQPFVISKLTFERIG